MPDMHLFLGLPLDASAQQQLEEVSPYVRETFIKNGSDYLHTATHNSQTFLGKDLGPQLDTQVFELVEPNLRSLLNRLLPQSSLSQTPLQLIALPRTAPNHVTS